jgi:hypothetical protein
MKEIVLMGERKISSIVGVGDVSSRISCVEVMFMTCGFVGVELLLAFLVVVVVVVVGVACEIKDIEGDEFLLIKGKKNDFEVLGGDFINFEVGVGLSDCVNCEILSSKLATSFLWFEILKSGVEDCLSV